MVQTEFERIMLERMNQTCDTLSKTREELVGLKQLVTDHIDFKVKQAEEKANAKEKSTNTKIAVISILLAIPSTLAIILSLIKQ